MPRPYELMPIANCTPIRWSSSRSLLRGLSGPVHFGAAPARPHPPVQRYNLQPLFIGGCGREISADVVRDADSQLVRLWLRQGTDFIGYYTGRWWEWMDYHDPVPRIRGEIRFLEFARRD